jgi:hypothetical protein
MNSITQQPEQSTIMPPAPPAAEEAFTPGEFEYADKWDRPYLKDAYQVISRNEWWGKFKLALTNRGVDRRTGFQFSEDPFYRKIMNAISETCIGGGHSGCSMGFTMRAMETIATYGEATYRRQVLEYQAEKQRNQEALRIRRELEEELRRQMNEEARHATRMAAQEEADRTIPADSIIEINSSDKDQLVYNNLYVCAHVANFEDIPINPKEDAAEEKA